MNSPHTRIPVCDLVRRNRTINPPPQTTDCLTERLSLPSHSLLLEPPLHSVPVIGLVGGVGSGKSSVARAAAEMVRSSDTHSHLVSTPEIVLVSGDEAGHAALGQADVRRRIRERFGDSVFDLGGEVDRSALGKLVFGPSAEHQQARQILEAIVHPEIHHCLKRQIEEARARPGVRAILLDAAVLLEAGWTDICDAVVFVDTPEEQRLQRVISGRGWTADQLRRREASQWPLDRKRSAANHVIPNNGDLGRAAGELWKLIERLAEGSHR